MAIRLRGNSYQVDVKVKGQRVRETVDDLITAKRVESEIKATLLAGKEWKSNSQKKREQNTFSTSGEFLDIAYKNKWSNAKTGLRLRRNAEQLIEIVGMDFPVSEWDEVKLDQLVQDMKAENLAPGTINRRLAALSVVLKEAYKAKQLDRIPVMPKQKEKSGRIRTLDNIPNQGECFEEKMLRFLLEREAYSFRDFCVAMIDTGARSGELLKLAREDISGGNVTFWETKNGGFRTVPLTQRVQSILNNRQDTDGKPFGDLTQRKIRYWWNEMKIFFQLTEVEDLVPYCMRHTCASRLARRGVNATIIQKWMGHSTLLITQRYVHMHGCDLEMARDVLESNRNFKVVK